MTLGNHLCSDQNIDLLGRQGAKNFFMGADMGGRIPVHPGNPGLREGGLDQFFQTLRSYAITGDPTALAFRA